MPLREPRPAAFFDRDGVLVVDHGYGSDPAKLELMPGALEAVRLVREAGYWVFVVTNQSGIGRGYYDFADFAAFSSALDERLNYAIDCTYHCPHRPEDDCDCRKPKPGMLHRAFADYPVQIEGSFLIGDRQSDLDAATSAGIQPVLYTEGRLDDLVRATLSAIRVNPSL